MIDLSNLSMLDGFLESVWCKVNVRIGKEKPWRGGPGSAKPVGVVLPKPSLRKLADMDHRDARVFLGQSVQQGTRFIFGSIVYGDDPQSRIVE